MKDFHLVNKDFYFIGKPHLETSDDILCVTLYVVELTGHGMNSDIVTNVLQAVQRHMIYPENSSDMRSIHKIRKP